jgi:YD repeat-containing protein
VGIKEKARLKLADSSLANPDQDKAYRYDAADNMVFNSGLCGGLAGGDNIVYPAMGPGSVRPHAPVSTCGSAVSYDANGNTTAYDPDGASGPLLARSFVYDGENRPTGITSNGSTTTFDYDAGGERIRKVNGSNTTWFIGNDGELKVDAVTPQGLMTSYVSGSVRRVGSGTDFLLSDGMRSIRNETRYGGGPSAWRDYGPAQSAQKWEPLLQNSSAPCLMAMTAERHRWHAINRQWPDGGQWAWLYQRAL